MTEQPPRRLFVQLTPSGGTISYVLDPREVHDNGKPVYIYGLQMADSVNARAPVAVGEGEYVAWCRYTHDNEGSIRTIVTCDSDAKDAFKVYRAPVSAIQSAPTESARKAADEIALYYAEIEKLAGFDSKDYWSIGAVSERVAAIITRHIGKVEDEDAK